jgi:hypothetical protein
MSDVVTAQFDWKDIEFMMEQAVPVARSAAAAAMNRAAAKARTESKRAIAIELKIDPQQLVAKRMRHTKAWAGAWPNLTTRISMIVRPIPAVLLRGVKYDATRGRATKGKIAGRARMGMTGNGVTASGGRHWPHAFIARGKRFGNLQIFERQGKPSHPLRAIKIETRQTAERIMRQRMEIASENLAANLEHEIAWRLNRLGTPAMESPVKEAPGA